MSSKITSILSDPNVSRDKQDISDTTKSTKKISPAKVRPNISIKQQENPVELFEKRKAKQDVKLSEASKKRDESYNKLKVIRKNNLDEKEKVSSAKHKIIESKNKLIELKTRYKTKDQEVKTAEKELSKAQKGRDGNAIKQYEINLKEIKNNKKIAYENFKEAETEYENQKNNLNILTKQERNSWEIYKKTKKYYDSQTKAYDKVDKKRDKKIVIAEQKLAKNFTALEKKENKDYQAAQKKIQKEFAAIEKRNSKVKNIKVKAASATATPAIEDTIYVNLQPNVGFNFEQDVAELLRSVFDPVILKKSEELIKTPTDEELIFQEFLQLDSSAIKEASKKEMLSGDVVHYKYNDIKCIKKTAASQYYNSNKIILGSGNYIASQGPYGSTMTDFVDMIAENDSPVSISLVEAHEFLTATNKFLENGKKANNEYLEASKIPTKTARGNKIEFIDSFIDNDLQIRADQLKINGKLHIRLYDLGWRDHAGGKAERILAMSCFKQKLLQNPEFATRKNNPVTINCNAGAGRTGTFITADTIVSNYIQNKESNVNNLVEQARESRVKFVQTQKQYHTLHLINNNKKMISPFLDRLSLK